ncbi:peptidylprolyl isomerase [Sphingomonas sp. CFBP 8760]|uniref:peptidylprolyl isomerase n=1 Tax=Sphingomonas sp. CFBP 8760 TaxID=2775282 RepID=UPI00177C28BF|nr:peptidylprolyl isomerase [Sphingomonas sp. CFBP 8760]MBD8548999.1 peptidylprolyl isomerase [Sphingomonas sp. CFBP 8760]
MLSGAPLGNSINGADVPTGQSDSRQATDATEPAAVSEALVAALLDRGAQIGNPFPTKDATQVMKTERSAAKAASIRNLAAAARRQGLDRSVDVLRTVTAFQEMLLAEKLMQSLSDTIVIDDKEVRSQFERHPDRYDEFEMSHIFFPFDESNEPATAGGKATAKREAWARAEAADAQLKAGADFAAVARSSSGDRESASEGGMLPAILGANVQPRFLEGIKGLKDGAISRILEGDDGYHIVLLNQRRHSYSGPARDMIEREIRARAMAQLLPKIQSLDSQQ